jgi:hypothetical protein
MYEQCFFSKSKNVVVDGCVNGVGLFGGRSLDQLASDYPDIEIVDVEAAVEIMDAANRRPVKETTKEQYWYALEVLPPQNWKQITGGDYFQMCEYWSGDITTYYAQWHDRYYTWMDNAWMKPADVLAKLAEFGGAA